MYSLHSITHSAYVPFCSCSFDSIVVLFTRLWLWLLKVHVCTYVLIDYMFRWRVRTYLKLNGIEWTLLCVIRSAPVQCSFNIHSVSIQLSFDFPIPKTVDHATERKWEGYIYIHVYIRYAPKKPSRCRLMKRNGTGHLMKRNGSFTIRSSSVRGPCLFSIRFESVLIKYYYIRIVQSALARGSL